METLSRLVLTFLLNAAWQITLLAAVAAGGARLLRRAPARYLNALWIAALALSALLPFATWRDSWNPANRLPTAIQGAQQVTTPGPAPRAFRTISERGSPGPLAQALTATPAEPPGTRHSRWLPNLFRHRRQPLSLPPLLAYAALGFYTLTLLCHLTRLLRAWRLTVKLRRGARLRDLPDGMAALVGRCRRALGLGNVSILCSSQAAGPAVVGFRRPVIILPEALIQGSPSEELIAALSHEMAHIRRHDYLLNLICEFLFLPVAFHPAAWLMKRRIDETRELACDEAAAGQLAGAPAYARSLLGLARAISALPSLSSPRYTLGVFDANILEERIMRLLETKPRAGARRAKLLLGGAALALTLVCLAACAFSFTAQETPKAQAMSANTGGTIAPRFLGTWRGEFQGKTFLVVTLQKEGDSLGGTVNVGAFSIDQSGQVARVKAEPNVQDGVPIVDAKWDGSLLSFKCKPGGWPVNASEGGPTVLQFQVRLTGGGAAELRGLGPPPLPGQRIPEWSGWWKVSKHSEDSNAEPRQSGAIGGVVGGVPGGVANDVNVGAVGGVNDSVQAVKGGVVGGVVGGVPGQEEKKPATLSGTVSDPSGARVPKAIVQLYNDRGKWMTATNEAGEFSFTDLPPGDYEWKVFHDGFEVTQQKLIVSYGSLRYQGNTYALALGGTSPHLDVVLAPASAMQSMVVTAKAPPEVIEKRHAAVPKRIRVGGEVEAAKLLTRVPPKYPESARARGVEGVVLLEAVISMEGVPLSLRVLESPDPELSDAALAAVRQWRYRPTLLNGDPIEVVTTIAITFRLEG